MPTLYGLPNCDTCKKARAWLSTHGIAHDFIDYRATPLTFGQLESAAAAIGWTKLINRASTTWRLLDDEAKSATTHAQWLALATAHPTLIRRPMLIDGQHVDAGFDPVRYAAHFAPGAQSA